MVKVLPFGLRSALKVYNAVADACGIHYLDDFFLFGEPRSSQCAEGLRNALARCEASRYQWPQGKPWALAPSWYFWPSR